MLEGSDLGAAYQSMNPSFSYQETGVETPAPPPKQKEPVQNVINQQYEQEQRLLGLLAEAQKKKPVQQQEPGYIEKLMLKKRDLGKLLIFSLVVLLALSVHMFVEHYLVLYITNNDMSFERQVFLRALYPLAVMFLLWNLKTFI